MANDKTYGLAKMDAFSMIYYGYKLLTSSIAY